MLKIKINKLLVSVFNKFDDLIRWKIRLFLQHTAPFSWIRNANYWFKYRFINEHKYNLVDTGLEPGYYEVDERMFHACFNLLVQFIEEETSWKHLICSDKEMKKRPWWMTLKRYCRKNRVKLGLGHLEWAQGLAVEMDENGDNVFDSPLQINYPGSQGWAAKEMKELYFWYKEIYPKRWSNTKYMYNLDDFYHEEQTNMLKRLIDVRGRLWT